MLSSAEIPIQTKRAGVRFDPATEREHRRCDVLAQELGSGQVHAATKPVLRQTSCPLVARLMITS